MISNYQTFQEGFIRGLATTPIRWIEQYKALFDMFSYLSDTNVKKAKIIATLNKVRNKLKLLNLDLTSSNHSFLKVIDSYAYWRHHLILNDKVYKKHIDNILKSGTSGPNIFVNIGWKSRQIPEIYNAKHTDDLVKVIDKYIARVTEIQKYIDKYPEKRKGFSKLMLWGIYGLRDLIIVLNAVANYSR
jgi:hypothetical protein